MRGSEEGYVVFGGISREARRVLETAKSADAGENRIRLNKSADASHAS